MKPRHIYASVFMIYALLAAPAAAQSFRAHVEPTVVAVRATYPTLVTPDQVGDLLNAIAWQHRPNIKLLKKSGGANCPSPQGERISCDILIWAPPGTAAEQTLHIDVLRDASGSGGLVPAAAFWQSHGPCTKRPDSGCEMTNALEPIAVGDMGPSNPTPTPTPPPGNTLELLTKLLELLVDNHEELLNVKAQLSQQTVRLNELERALANAWEDLTRQHATPPELPPVTIPCLTGRAGFLGRVTLCPVEALP